MKLILWTLILVLLATQDFAQQAPAPSCEDQRDALTTHVQILTAARNQAEANLADVFSRLQRTQKERDELAAKMVTPTKK